MKMQNENRITSQVYVHMVDEHGMESTGNLGLARKKFLELRGEDVEKFSKKQIRIYIYNLYLAGEFKGWPIKTKRHKELKKLRKTKPKDWSGVDGYKNYLLSSEWRTIRKIVIDRDGCKCTKCNSTKRLQVHHLTYRNIFNEKNHLEDLITLCRECHKKEHKK